MNLFFSNGYMESAQSLFNALSGYSYFSRLDLKSGFHLCPLTEDSQLLTTFCTPFGLFYYKRLTMGLKTSPSSFNQIMLSVLNRVKPELRQFVRHYLDDIIIYTTNRRMHKLVLDEVFRVLNEVGLILSIDKVHLMRKEINILGMIVSKEGRRVDPERVRAIQLLKPPKNIKGVQRFMGVVNFCSPSCSHFQKLAYPITELLTKQKSKKFIWTEECDIAFQNIKNEIASERV